MGFFSKKEKPIKATFKNVETNTIFNLELLEDRLQIGIPLAKVDQLKTLRYDQIKDVVYTSDIQTISKSKSPIGRAIAGGLLFGGTGAIVGAISGVGTKEKKEYKFYLIINYTSKTGEDKFLQYEDQSLNAGLKFSKLLKEKANIQEPDQSNEL
jgi:hypothetical protein